jgi:hypothetical protein
LSFVWPNYQIFEEKNLILFISLFWLRHPRIFRCLRAFYRAQRYGNPHQLDAKACNIFTRDSRNCHLHTMAKYLSIFIFHSALQPIDITLSFLGKLL